MKLSSLHSPVNRNALMLFLSTSTPGEHCTFFYSDPGEGKTSIARAVAAALGVDDAHYERWSVGQMDTADFNGYPTPRADGLHFETPARVARLCDGAPAMFVLDEAGNADRMLQAAMLKPLDSRTIGETRIPNSCRIVGFLNPPDTTTDMHDLAFALMNRGPWLQWEAMTDEDHVGFMVAGSASNVALPEWVGEERWRECYNEVVALYATFKTQLHLGSLREDCKSAEVKSRWPMVAATPRSWDLFLRLAATCRAYGDTVAMRAFAKGTIGEPQANIWMNYYETADLVPAPEWLKDKTLFTPDPRRTDRTFAQLTAMAMYVCNQNSKRGPKEQVAMWHAGWDCIKHVLDSGEGEDVALLAAQELFRNMPKGGLAVGYEELIKRFAPLTTVTLMFQDATR